MQVAPNSRGGRPSEPSHDLRLNAQHAEIHAKEPVSANEQHTQSALDTLAEVSRRHLDYSQPNHLEHDPEYDTQGADDRLADETLLSELQNHGIITAAYVSLFIARSHYSVRNLSAHTSPPSSSHPATTTFDASPLVEAASAASRQLELDQGQRSMQDQAHLPLDPQLKMTSPELRTSPNIPAPVVPTRNESQTMTWTPKSVNTSQASLGAFRLASDYPSEGFGLLQKPTNSNKRGRFDDERRKEVSEIRKRGACIRCRMLKKPCSGETPCSTCKNVESARVWKTRCLRTRLVDEFTLWSLGLFHGKVRVREGRVLQDRVQSLSPGHGHGRARLSTDGDRWFSVTTKAYSNDGEDVSSSAVMALVEDEHLEAALAGYAEASFDTLEEQRSSDFMRTTLECAHRLTQDLEMQPSSANSTGGSGPISPRPSYNLHSQLLQNCIKLYNLTDMLLAPYEKWSIQLQSSTGVEAVDASEQPFTDLPASSPSRHLIIDQIKAAIELHCSKLCKTAMNELERQLLQRQQVSRLVTFISAVILLSCVERMTGLFHSFDTVTGTDDAQARSNMKEDDDDWPLEVPPSAFWIQGQQFADLLVMLLRLRALPPRTIVNANGALVVSRDPNSLIRAQSRTSGDQMAESARMAADWLEPLQLKATDLVRKRDDGAPGVEEGVEAWELKFVASLLLPENYR
ncbi:hypothetical protein BDY17DRAFT_308291 [Neohortaea acidophila]|uniref:Zn(2)-C6 fungal-type domain-containing protein n=1 Tax=Neohortaea acidophila TaxID=245834 RepID=A0A6A6Q3S2_9PEZI|nr:uncharacterized protein BDY17DRAFT_308291 [Neohortaea acidophila]KAF2486945.1 hypothetical protein BDY17DRAFT_308291 [Neohortaea acidophila]